jgi:TonB family protein
MKSASFPFLKLKKSDLFSFFLAASLILSLAALSPAQTQKSSLSLADILIALRSKKATLDERNKILTDAVKERGITFVITREIEKELVNTGAANDLLEVLRQKSSVAKVAPAPVSTPAPTPVSTPVSTPTPLDYTFYQKRADALVAKGDLDSALNDYNRAAELNPKEVSIYLNRGLVLFNKKNYEQAVADYDKAIELNPKDSAAFFNRGNSYEKIGDIPKALADYQKAVELDANNEPAKTNLKRIQDEQARLLAEQKKQEAPPVAETPKPAAEKPKLPEFVDLGQISAASVVRMVKPIYPAIAQKSNVTGQVVVQVTLDEEGNVTAAKAINGHALLRSASEDAAEKSKFKPAMIGNQAVKAKGLIIYNFSR